MLGQGDQGAVGAEDAGLFASDGGDGGAEPFGVVERDVGDDGEERIDDVGRVEAAAHADFEDCDIDGGVSEVEEGHGGKGFKKARELTEFLLHHQLLAGVVDAEVEAGKGVVGNLNIVDANTFVGPGEMRRGVHAGAQPGDLEDGGEGRRGRAFAVGSSDEDGTEAVMGAAEGGEEGTDFGEGEFATSLARLGMKLRGHGTELMDGLGVRHEKNQYRRRGWTGDQCYGPGLGARD